MEGEVDHQIERRRPAKGLGQALDPDRTEHRDLDAWRWHIEERSDVSRMPPFRRR